MLGPDNAWWLRLLTGLRHWAAARLARSMVLRSYGCTKARGLEADPSELVRIPLDRLRIGTVIRRSGQNARHVAALSEVAAALPPIVVHRSSMTVIDGVHRVRAAQDSGSQWIDAVYFDGDDGQALLLAVRLNTAHGLPLSAADRKAAAEQALAYYPDWSNRRLAMAIGLSERAIAAIRRKSATTPRRETRPAAAVAVTTGDIQHRHERARTSSATPAAARRAGGGRASGSPTQSMANPALNTGHPLPVSRQPAPDRAYPTRALRNLCSDPAVSRTESGRRLLALLALIPADPEAWADLADNLPPYHAALIADLAAQQARNWAALARTATRHAVTENHTAA
ncbi:ParB/RepB/Spo0J family partition protein [Nocardia tengchongensis]|uniref:ParB/RepB/Spo0J family partition protein n=1 Tax=Nocardia tengchongensis TaxID=2055889 RepID=UPI0036061D4C